MNLQKKLQNAYPNISDSFQIYFRKLHQNYVNEALVN